MAVRDTLTPDSIGGLPLAPMAERRPTQREYHGISVDDDYAWLKDESYPDVKDEDILEHLQAENEYFNAALKPHAPLTARLNEEIKGRMKEDDKGVPFKDGDWLYHWEFEPGAQYRRWFRRPVAGGEAEVIIDEPKLAKGLDYFSLDAWAVCPKGELLAWSADSDGSERYVLKVRDLGKGKDLDDVIENTIGTPAWSADGTSFMYLELNDQWRPFRIKLHLLGTDPKDDRTILEESDSGFFLSVYQTQDRNFFILASGDHVTSEARLLPTDAPTSAPTLVEPRKAGHEYYVEHVRGTLYIRTNDTHRNFRIVSAPLESPGAPHWKEVISASDERYIRDIATFSSFYVLQQRTRGLDEIHVSTYDHVQHGIEFKEPCYSAELGTNEEFDVDRVRIDYDSLVTPHTVYDYEVASKKLETLKVKEIPSGYNPDLYATERFMAPGRDGVEIPVSVVYRKDTPRDGTSPLHLYGYGAYGHGIPPSFVGSRLSLLNRGFVFAIAHIRGGDEMGYHWYEQGKLEHRTNTFNDFVDVARHLIQKKYAAEGGISIRGGSAGGELMGAVLNAAPELWRAVIADVPFVDVLNTMLDDSLPLTPMEWPEWGNPIEDPKMFELIKGYSPYDNIQPKAYPPILITGGLSDPRVTYWEPAKFAAKLRALKTNDNLVLLKTNMGAGHGGKSGRYEVVHETAERLTFLLMAFGLTDAAPKPSV